MLVVILLSMIVFPLLVMFFSFAYYRLTGYYERPYPTVPCEQKIKLANSLFTCDQLIRHYKPIIYQSPFLRGPKPSNMSCEVIKESNQKNGHDTDGYTLVYRVVWDTEQHPHWLLDKFYNIFRWAFYGSPIDIEFLQLRINSKGEVIELLFESDPRGDPDINFPEHARALIRKNNDNKTWTVLLNQKTITNKRILKFEDCHYILKVLTWNHVFSLDQEITDLKRYDLPVKLLSDQEYRRLKSARRSWGSYGVYVHRGKTIKKGFYFGLFLTIITYLIIVLVLWISST